MTLDHADYEAPDVPLGGGPVRAYLSGPIDDDRGCFMMDVATDALAEAGFLVTSPLNIRRAIAASEHFDPVDIAAVYDDGMIRESIGRDVRFLLNCDAIVMLVGWATDTSSCWEYSHAVGAGLDELYWSPAAGLVPLDDAPAEIV
ncbi:MAG: hypothetical protein ACRD6B_03830 [Bryobacteraceae bacterium]